MLLSSLLGESEDLVRVAAGEFTLRFGHQSDAVLRIQQALLGLGFDIPAGPTGFFGNETATAVIDFKQSRELSPPDAVVGVGTSTRMDREIAFCEGVPLQQASVEGGFLDAVFEEPAILASDAFISVHLDRLLPGRGIPDKILKFFELSDEFCLPIAALWGPLIASVLGKLVDPKIMTDYLKLQPPDLGHDFFDLSNDSTLYRLFLETHNPTVAPPLIDSTAESVRPDILRHRPDKQEWYETKPLTPSGVTEWLAKAIRLRLNYAGSFPYVAGTAYRPSSEILLGRFGFTEGGGGQVEVFIEARRPANGMLLYRICLRGDYVRYFNNVRMAAGILAIFVALAPEILAAGVATAAEVAAFVAAIASIAAEFAVILPILARL